LGLSLAEEALQHEEGSLIERGIQKLLSTARDMADQKDWVGAGTVCQSLLTALAENIDQALACDEEGDLDFFGEGIVELLGECLVEGNPDSERRAKWFGALLQAEFADFGVDAGLTTGAFDLILEHAEPGEWEPLEKEIRSRLQGCADWARQRLSEMLAAWYGENGGPEAQAAVIRETGTPEQIMFLLAEEGQVGQALGLARQHFVDRPGVVVRLAGQLIKDGFPEEAVAFVAGVAHEHSAYVQWLAKYYLEREEWDKALEWQRRYFLLGPSAGSFLALGSTAQKVGDWERLRPQFLQVLEGKEKWSDLLRIALAEGDARRALDLFSRHSAAIWSDCRKDLAGAAEKDFPAEAASIYQEIAQGYIKQQQRGAYQEAARYLVRAKALYERTGATAQWQKYIAGLKGRYPRHRALQEEFRSAGL